MAKNDNESDYCSSEESISPIMSQETFDALGDNLILESLDHEFYRDLDANQVLIAGENANNELMSSDAAVEEKWTIEAPQPSHSGATRTETESLIPNIKGKHGFDVVFSIGENESFTKSVPWTYSRSLDQLFVSFNLPCPIRFFCSSPPPFGTVIRATPYYKQPVSYQHPVLRCLNHQRTDDVTNKGFDESILKHIMRCESTLADYHTNAISERVSVVVPYPEGPAMQKYFGFNYRFMCFSSCIGGMNRRPILVSFTLEHGNNVIGRKVLEVRICASPGRDRRKAEEKLFNTRGFVTRSILPQQNVKIEIPDHKEPPLKKSKTEHSEDDELFTVSINFQVRGKRNSKIYQNILNSIKKDANKH